jgi:hypothetical protein
VHRRGKSRSRNREKKKKVHRRGKSRSRNREK